MNVKESLIDVIGNTPLVHLKNIECEFGLESHIYAKLERSNPTGSIKDRASKYMIISALKRKVINKNTVIVEPTSGNTGIGLCAVLASLGMKAMIFMPENMSKERILMMKAYGAEIVLTDKSEGMAGAIGEAKKYVESHPNSFMPEQFENEDNVLAHYETTGPEIYNDLDSHVDLFVAAFGTGGTLTGVSKYLKEKNKDIITIGVEPKESPFVSEGKKGSHKIQGIGAGFKPGILNLDYVDRVEEVPSDKAYEFTRLLARKEGYFCGISSGANLYQLVEEAKKNKNKGKNLVTVFPDNGERYLSVEGLFDLYE